MTIGAQYHTLSRVLHWLMALMFFGMVAVGSYMVDLPDDAPDRMTLMNIHKATGFIFFWLVIMRFIWNVVQPAPALPTPFSKTERTLMKSTKHALYLAMFMVPLSGWAMSNFAGYAIKLGDFSVPLLYEKNKAVAGAFHEAHELLPWLLLALVVVHITAVIYHKLEGGEKDILKRML